MSKNSLKNVKDKTQSNSKLQDNINFKDEVLNSNIKLDNNNKTDDNLGKQNPMKNAASSRQYLESTVVKAVMQGMAELTKIRPDNPLEYLGNYLIKMSKESNNE